MNELSALDIGKLQSALIQAFTDFWKHVPTQFRGEGKLTIPYRAAVPKLQDAIGDLVLPILEANFKVKPQLLQNIEKFDNGSPEETILEGTPLEPLLSIPLSFDLPETSRFEHHWIIAPPGTGKTQCLQYLILEDLEKVRNDRASVVIIDSQNELIPNIAKLSLFETYPEKLCLIEPNPEHPIAINLFDIGEPKDAREKERRINSTLEIITYVFGNLLETEMTAKQDTLWRHALRACFEIPDATILTLEKLILDKSFSADHFSDQFQDKQFDSTRQEIGWRLSHLLENSTFKKMFSAPKSKINLYDELLSAKVICINTDKDLLGEHRTEIFGRFFIALLLQATEHRASISAYERTPVFCYIDEAQDYIRRDAQHIERMLDQARKQSVSLTIAHQRCNQLAPKVLDALTNTAIKFAAGSTDARFLATHMQTNHQFIETQPKGHFAAHIRGVTKQAVSIRVPFGVVEAEPHMSPEEWRGIKRQMHERYSSPLSIAPPSPSAPSSPAPSVPSTQEEPAPIAKW